MLESKVTVGYERVKNLGNYESERYKLDVEEVISFRGEPERDEKLRAFQDYVKVMVQDAMERRISPDEFKAAGGEVAQKPKVPDTNAAATATISPATNGYATPGQVKFIYDLAAKSEDNQKRLEEVMDECKIAKVDEFSKETASKLIEELKRRR